MNGLARKILCLLMVVLLLAPVLVASEGASEDPVNTLTGTVFRWLNFAIVATVVVLAFRKTRGTFRGRADSISNAIQQAAAVKQESELRLRAIEEKLARFDQEVAALREAAQRDAAAEAEKIRALAQDEALRVDRAAQLEMEASERAARMELKAIGARLAVERAEALLRKQLTPDVQSKILRGFTEELARSAN